MSWIQKLCEVYDAIIGTPDCDMLSVGFINKNIELNIILSAKGEFVTAERVPENDRHCAVPSTIAAEARTGSSIKPYPLAEQLKYLIVDGEADDAKFCAYMQQLGDWCSFPGAPDCIKVLYSYLEKQTLFSDLMNVPGLNLRSPYKDVVCFSIQDMHGENRLWMRGDVRESWGRYWATLLDETPELCYATGQVLPGLQSHPKLDGNPKLISARDVDFPFQYKGRFIEDRSAAALSGLASVKAHNALLWLIDHQGFNRYGMHIVAWNTAIPVLNICNDPFGYESENKAKPDTFEAYAIALRDAANGYTETLKTYTAATNLTKEAHRRMNEIVIIGLQAATQGRMSITYYQEMPGNMYVSRLNAWADDCLWEMPGANKKIRTPTWIEICSAVMGRDAVNIARSDRSGDKNATKLMRGMQLRLLGCVVDGAPLPLDMVEQAFARAVRPLSFTDSKGAWNGFAWAECVAVACALMRKESIQSGRGAVSPELDKTCTDRDYLFGRLLAVSHKIEFDAAESGKFPTNALRLMQSFVQSPRETWLHLYCKLLPYLKQLGQSGRGNRAAWYLTLLGEIERSFAPEERAYSRPLSYMFLAGFSAQLSELYAKAEQRKPSPPFEPYSPPSGRDELFGCLLAAADICEWDAMAEEHNGIRTSQRDGRTNAMLLTNAYVIKPSFTWMHIHDKLIPYLEKSGVSTAAYIQRIISRIESSFAAEERLKDARLGSGFLNGYLSMRHAMTAKGGLKQDAWAAQPASSLAINSRDAAFGALLALDNIVERIVLDAEKQENDNRPSNAMRLMPHVARRPDAEIPQLMARMEPYMKKLRQPFVFMQERERLLGIATELWPNKDAPLGPGYLHTFYTYTLPSKYGKED